MLVDKSDLNQAQVLFATKGIPRDVPEYLEVRAGLKILGESFGSRLFEEIRVRRGLTYGIHPIFDPREKAGPLGIFTFTRVDKLPELVTETLKVYRAFVAGGVTDAEVQRIKAQMRTQFVRMFETSDSLARQLLILNRYGIAEDYLADHMHKLARVSTATVNAAIKRYFNPDDLRILIYAPRASAEPTLKALGPVEVKSYKLF
jgi:zinc protease